MYSVLLQREHSQMTQASRAAQQLTHSWCPVHWPQLLFYSIFSRSCFLHYKLERWRPPSSCGLNKQSHDNNTARPGAQRS